MRDDERGGRVTPGSQGTDRPVEGANTAHDAELSRRELLKIVAGTSALAAAHMMLPSEWSNPVVDIGALPAHAQTSGGKDAGTPTGFSLKATRNSDGQVTLSWTTPTGIDSLEIYRQAAGQSEERIAVADSAAGSMVDYTAPKSALTYRGAITGGTATATVAGAQ
jgi:hypothetical protein